MIERQPCPACGQPVAEINWEPTLVRSNISEAGIIGGALFDEVFAVPPGIFTALPCGHRVSPEAGQAIGKAYGSHLGGRDEGK